MANDNQLSRRGAVVVGLLFIASGLFPIAVGLGFVTPSGSDLAAPPGWVPAAAGLVFALGGGAILLDYGVAGGVGSDGNLLPGTPLWIQTLNLALGLGIVGLLTALSGWVAFGRGPRAFSTTVALPFYVRHNANAGELSGRIAFGAGAILLAAMFCACATVGVRRLTRAWSARDADKLT
jgi:hypothetical protein